MERLLDEGAPDDVICTVTQRRYFALSSGREPQDRTVIPAAISALVLVAGGDPPSAHPCDRSGHGHHAAAQRREDRRDLDGDANVVQMALVCSLTVDGLHCEAVPGEIAQAIDADGIELEVADGIASRPWEEAGGHRRHRRHRSHCALNRARRHHVIPIIGDLVARAKKRRVPALLLDAALLQLRTHHEALICTENSSNWEAT